MLGKAGSLSRAFARAASASNPASAIGIKRGENYATKRNWEDRMAPYYDMLEFKPDPHQIKLQVVNGNELHFFRGDQVGLIHSQELVQQYMQQRPALAIDCMNHVLDYMCYEDDFHSDQ